jgi:acyl dehydratase
MPVEPLDEIQSKAGQEIGVSGWLTMDQQRIDEFAESTEDRQMRPQR